MWATFVVSSAVWKQLIARLESLDYVRMQGRPAPETSRLSRGSGRGSRGTKRSVYQRLLTNDPVQTAIRRVHIWPRMGMSLHSRASFPSHRLLLPCCLGFASSVSHSCLCFSSSASSVTLSGGSEGVLSCAVPGSR